MEEVDFFNSRGLKTRLFKIFCEQAKQKTGEGIFGTSNILPPSSPTKKVYSDTSSTIERKKCKIAGLHACYKIIGIIFHRRDEKKVDVY